MVKLFVGGKGSGKTKALIELCNNAANTSTGSVVCIEKGNHLQLDITYKARLIDTDPYAIDSADALYGLICGILGSNSDITDVFVDAAFRIAGSDIQAFETLVNKINAIAGDVNVVMAASIPVEDCTPGIKAYV